MSTSQFTTRISVIAAVAATLPAAGIAAAQERGRARDLDATVAELLIELSK